MVVLLACPALANPLLGTGGAAPATGFAWLVEWQSKVNHELAEITLALQQGASLQVAGWALVLSFLYGVLHAAGPGHAKTVVASYFLTRQAKWVEGVMMALRVALVHIATSVIIVTMIYLAISPNLLNSAEGTRWVSIISYALIVMIGIYLIARALRLAPAPPHGEVCCEGAHDEKSAEKYHRKTDAIIGFAAGMIPCPGPILVMLFALAHDLIPFGILASLFMAMGMFLTIMTVALLAIAGKAGVFKAVEGPLTMRLSQGLALLGGLIITAFGALELFSLI
ncbi:MAG: nickel/cobalt transporter [Dongiaceae bacterium]